MSKKGFSLVELLVVVSIIAVVMAVIIPQISRDPQVRSRDAVRKTDINLLADTYFKNAIGDTSYKPLTVDDFGGKVPVPPEGGTYQGLLSENSQTFKICAQLEKGKNINCLANSDNPNCYCRSSNTDSGSGNEGYNNGGGGGAILPTPSPSPSPSPSAYPQLVPGYGNVESKFFETYAVYFFDRPDFPPPGGGYSAHLSLNPDFSGDYTQTYKNFGIPSCYGQDAPPNISWDALKKLTGKCVGFASTPSYYAIYNRSNCGKTIYLRIANYYANDATDKKVGPTYSAKFDCTTKVGMVDPPTSWYSVWDYATQKQKKYEAVWDFDQNGTIDWTDYWLGAFATKIRYGGWAPPE